MEDILWYLHKFIDPRQYSLLNKKYRDIYFREEGIILKNFDNSWGYGRIGWMYKFLARYKIHLHIVWQDGPVTPIYGVTHIGGPEPQCAFSNEYTEKILENIVSITGTERSIDKYTIKLLQRLPNVKSISGYLHIELTELIDFLKIPNSTPEKIFYNYRNEGHEYDQVVKVVNLLRAKNIKFGVWLDNRLVDVRYFGLAQFAHIDPGLPYIDGVALPELVEIVDYFTKIPNIAAPKLQKIRPYDIYVAAEMVKKYKTITHIDVESFQFENTPKFIEAYETLKDHQFSLKINIEDVPSLLKLEVSKNFVRTIYVKDKYGMEPNFIKDAEKLFYVRR